MRANKVDFFSRTKSSIGLSVIAVVFVVGCASDGSDTEGEQNTPMSDDVLYSEFDGTWRSACFEYRVFMVPEEDQPDGYVQTTLMIDSSTNTFSENRPVYTDSQCINQDTDENVWRRSGEIIYNGVVITRSGIEATSVRYLAKGSSPDLNGLLYREGDVLYRDIRESSLIEDDVIPDRLSFNNTWQLVVE